MELLGRDFRAGLRHALYRPYNPAGLKAAIFIFIFLVFTHQVILGGLITAGIAALGASDFATFQSGIMRGGLLSLFPAGLLSVLFAWVLARRRGADPREVLALRFPALGLLGWLAVIVGFVALIYGIAIFLVWLLGVVDTGLVEQALMQLDNDPLYILIIAGIVLGGPLAEEFIFRGQIFAALSQTRIGYIGSAIVTSAVWAALHITEPLHFVGVIFLMGLVLSWLLVRFGSLWVTIACHVTWNAGSAILLSSMAPK